MELGERIAAQALALRGVPFRLRGRAAQTGLDCVGLALLALRGAGCVIPDPPSYGLRGFDAARAERMLAAAGLARIALGAPGDIVLADSGPLQLHLMIHAAAGLVHAHAGLGRVVLMPHPSPWPVRGLWRVRPSTDCE
jgi:murein DD-endopeptidase / murein LD-carboxypeptidase